jgi:hypothetical protein
VNEPEKPLHVRVAEALGWTSIGPGNSMNLSDPGAGYPPKNQIVGHKEPIPRYDTDWAATGPLIERYGIDTEAISYSPTDRTYGWKARACPVWNGDESMTTYGETPLLAVCALILALHEAGKLKLLLTPLT